MTCISDLYYKIGWWFTVGMFCIAAVTLPFALEAWSSVVSFLMCVGIAGVGAAPHYKEHEHNIHFVSACISAVCSVVWTAHVCWPCIALLVVGAIVAMADKKRWLLWCEVGCFSMVFAALVARR